MLQNDYSCRRERKHRRGRYIDQLQPVSSRSANIDGGSPVSVERRLDSETEEFLGKPPEFFPGLALGLQCDQELQLFGFGYRRVRQTVRGKPDLFNREVDSCLQLCRKLSQSASWNTDTEEADRKQK